jgi:hypothetical protein
MREVEKKHTKTVIDLKYLTEKIVKLKVLKNVRESQDVIMQWIKLISQMKIIYFI